MKTKGARRKENQGGISLKKKRGEKRKAKERTKKAKQSMKVQAGQSRKCNASETPEIFK